MLFASELMSVFGACTFVRLLLSIDAELMSNRHSIDKLCDEHLTVD
jgi:hypothetical protein